MRRLLRFLFMVALLVGAGGAAYVAIADIPAPRHEIVKELPSNALH